jgi:hypothetical protein
VCILWQLNNYPKHYVYSMTIKRLSQSLCVFYMTIKQLFQTLCVFYMTIKRLSQTLCVFYMTIKRISQTLCVFNRTIKRISQTLCVFNRTIKRISQTLCVFYDSAWNEGQPWTGPKKKFWASKILVTGPNGIMVAQTFCNIFFYEKKTSDINI